MALHVIIDFMHIYYKYYFQLQAGKLRWLSTSINGVETDTTLIYYPLRDIESIRKQFEDRGHEVVVSVCFDSKSVKAEENSEYKSGRTHRLVDKDFENIDKIKELLTEAGHNVYTYTGYEADDIVSSLVNKFKDEFEFTIIYTNDKDLLINICDNVGIMRFKQYKGYTQADRNNYEQYVEQEFKVYLPYNTIGLYLSIVGDSADHIKGIDKFGPKAFSKLITKIGAENNINWSQCSDWEYTKNLIDNIIVNYVDATQFEQLKSSFELVRNLSIEDITKPINKSNKDKRQMAYEKYNMTSLI